jgi:hypothetical protein
MATMAQTTDSHGNPLDLGNFVRYHGSKRDRVRAVILKVGRIYPDGLMDLRYDGAFPFQLYGVRPRSVTLDC